MPVYSRNLLLFFALAAAAILTFGIARDATELPVVPDRGPPPPARGYYAIGTVLHLPGDDGRFAYRVHADRVEQASRQDDFRLDGVSLKYAEAAELAWELTAEAGVLSRDRESMQLSDFRLTTGVGAESEAVTFEARSLGLDLRNRTASTREPVILQSSQCETRAKGMNVDLDAGTHELLEAATTCRHKAARVPVITLFLIAGAAAAQDEQRDEIYSIACQSLGGALRTDEYTCSNAVITDEDSFRLTAGLASITDSRGVNFRQSEWHLTGGVRINFGTAELAAESAVIVFGADGLLDSFELVGAPAELLDLIEGQERPLRITAPGVRYERSAGTLSMSGEVVFSDGQDDGNALTSCGLTYWLEDKRYLAGSPQCGAQLSLGRPSGQDSNEDPPAEP